MDEGGDLVGAADAAHWDARDHVVHGRLRQAVEDCGVSRYEIAKQTGIDEATLSKFANRHRGLSMEAMDAVGVFLELTISSGQKPGKKTTKEN